MAKPWPIALVLTACAAAPPPPAAKPVPPRPSTEMAITDTGVGRVDAKTRTTLEGLRATLRGYEVRPVYDGGLEYHVYKDGEHLYYVIPTTGSADKLFNVHVLSGKFSVAKHPWRAGAPFSGASLLSRCECWGDAPVCYTDGEHVAVAFKRGCTGISDTEDPHARVMLDGVAVQRMIWSPTAFGPEKAAETTDEANGVEGGVEGGDAGD